MKPSRRLTVILAPTLLLAVSSVLVHARDGDGDPWHCVAVDDPEEGEGHDDSAIEGWLVKSPDGQHVEWGEGVYCTDEHTPVGS